MRCLLFHAEEDVLASGLDDGTICLWYPGAGEAGPILNGHTQAVLCLAFDRESSRLVSGSKDGTVCCWDVARRRLVRVFEGPLKQIVGVAISSNGQTIAAIDRTQSVWMWRSSDPNGSAETEEMPLTLLSHQASTWKGELVSPDLLQESIHYWAFQPDGQRYQLAQEHTQLLDLAFQPDGSLLVAGYCWGVTHVWGLTDIEA
jgi:WD40 repeat protein